VAAPSPTNVRIIGNVSRPSVMVSWPLAIVAGTRHVTGSGGFAGFSPGKRQRDPIGQTAAWMAGPRDGLSQAHPIAAYSRERVAEKTRCRNRLHRRNSRIQPGAPMCNTRVETNHATSAAGTAAAATATILVNVGS
jgi:hypothetical protein